MASAELREISATALALMGTLDLGRTKMNSMEKDILEIKHAKATAERERALAPTDPPYLPRVPLILSMLPAWVKFDEEKAKYVDGVMRLTTFVGNEKHFCKTPLPELRKSKKSFAVRPLSYLRTDCLRFHQVGLSEMRVHKIHRVCHPASLRDYIRLIFL
jgi:hypothetical protein